MKINFFIEDHIFESPIGSGFYLKNENKTKLVFIEKNKITKKNIKKYERAIKAYSLNPILSQEELYNSLSKLVAHFRDAIKITHVLGSRNDLLSGKTRFDNIMYLWYDEGICHFKYIDSEKIKGASVAGELFVNTCNKKIDNYIRILTLSEMFLENTCYLDDDRYIGDEETEGLLKLFN